VSSVESSTDKISSFDGTSVSTVNTFFREVSLKLGFEAFGFFLGLLFLPMKMTLACNVILFLMFFADLTVSRTLYFFPETCHKIFQSSTIRGFDFSRDDLSALTSQFQSLSKSVAAFSSWLLGFL